MWWRNYFQPKNDVKNIRICVRLFFKTNKNFKTIQIKLENYGSRKKIYGIQNKYNGNAKKWHKT
jgi:hypothetical protein